MTTEAPNLQLPVPLPADEKTVDRDFWKKLLKVAGRIPFAEDAAAAYFCATDPATPSKVKATLFAALAYFVMPFDVVPDFLAGVGFTDDAAVIALALGMVAREIKDEHRAKARAALHIAEPARA
ncbi:MAG TPA: YkvA family protein [Rhizomicrobium sp.]|nr:YkvA family protein [Rhizomicrobium sp.]